MTAPDDWEVLANGRTERIESRSRTRAAITSSGPRASAPTSSASARAPTPCGSTRRPASPRASSRAARWPRYVDADEIFEITRQGFDFYEAYFGIPYPYHKYDQIVRARLQHGRDGERRVRRPQRPLPLPPRRHRGASAATARNVILHEMAHMWFGDLVTMEWWDDLWLNESFATYMATLSLVSATRFKDGFEAFQQDEKRWAYWQDQLPTTHPIATDVPDTVSAFTNFDGITYGKGASVLKQLAFFVGPGGLPQGRRRPISRATRTATPASSTSSRRSARRRARTCAPGRRPGSRRRASTGSAVEARSERRQARRGDARPDGRQRRRAAAPPPPPRRRLRDATRRGRVASRARPTSTIDGARARGSPALEGLETPLFLVANHDDHAYAKSYLDDGLARLRDEAPRGAARRRSCAPRSGRPCGRWSATRRRRPRPSSTSSSRRRRSRRNDKLSREPGRRT